MYICICFQSNSTIIIIFSPFLFGLKKTSQSLSLFILKNQIFFTPKFSRFIVFKIFSIFKFHCTDLILPFKKPEEKNEISGKNNIYNIIRPVQNFAWGPIFAGYG